MCGFLYVNVARRNCPVTLHCVTLLRERALLYKARVRYKSRHSDHKEEFASAQRSQMQKCSPRVHSRANIFAFEKNAEHLQIRRSVIWVESPKSHKRTAQNVRLSLCQRSCEIIGSWLLCTIIQSFLSLAQRLWFLYEIVVSCNCAKCPRYIMLFTIYLYI